MTSRPVEFAQGGEGRLTGRSVTLRPVTFCGLVLIGALGWCWGAYERFVQLPGVNAGQRISTSLQLIDKFAESEAQRSYVKLSEDLKPWWTMIQEEQRRIMAATSDTERETLIARRDELLIAYVRDHELGPSIDLLVDAFDPFERCLTVGACDDETIRKSISIDVKRLYRTFKPYIMAKREAPNLDARDRDFGKGLENLFFRFLG